VAFRERTAVDFWALKISALAYAQDKQPDHSKTDLLTDG
jgi:hypothetical protein